MTMTEERCPDCGHAPHARRCFVVEQNVQCQCPRKMNAYFIDGGDCFDKLDGYYRLVDIVIAPSRPRARYLFWKAYTRELGDLTDPWCKTIRLVSKDVHGTLREGLLPYAHVAYQELWKQADEVIG